MLELATRAKTDSRFQFLGITLQEAHAADVWPIGKPACVTPNATYSIQDRVDNCKSMLDTLPTLSCLEWFVDIPTSNPNHHVGGSFNDIFGAWPHRYFVLDQKGCLLFRPQFHKKGPMEYYIDFEDLREFLSSRLNL